MQSGNPSSPFGLPDAPAVYRPTEDEVSLIADSVTWVRQSERSRDRFVRIWELIRNFIRGEQNLYQSETGEVVRLIEKNSRRLISVNNQMKIASRQLHAKLTKHVPDFNVDPSNGDQDQVQAAMAGTEFTIFFREKEDFILKYLAAMLDVVETGCGFLELNWDPLAGRRMAVCDTCSYTETTIDNLGETCPACVQDAEETAALHQQTMAAAQGATDGGVPVEPPEMPETKIGELVEYREGDVKLSYLNPREFLPEPGCTDMKPMRKWCTRRVVPMGTLRERYPRHADVLKPKSGLYNFNSVKVIRSTRQGEYNYDEYQEHGYETVFNEMPSMAYPKGRRWVVVNDEVLVDYKEEHPLWFLGRPNIYALFWDKENDTFYPQPFGEHAWHRQKELNENETQQRENSEINANGKVLVAQHSGIRPDELTATTGQVVMYNPGLPKPEPLRLGELSPDVYNRGGIVKNSIFEQASISAAEQQMVSGDVSGRALAIVQAEADQQVGPTLKRIFAEMGELTKGAIMIARRFYLPDRQFRVVGDQGLQVFTLADMELADGYDIRVVAEEGLSKNQEIRLNRMMDFLQLGLFSNPSTGVPDMNRFVKAAKLRLPGFGGDKTTSQRTHAHYMLREIQNGNFAVQPMPWDDPIAHGEVMLDWLQTKGYNPNTHPAIIQHVYALFKYYMQWAMTQAMPGAAPSAGPAPGPSAGGQQTRMQAAGQPGPGGQNAQPSMLSQAANQVQAADRSAENQARARTMPREGR